MNSHAAFDLDHLVPKLERVCSAALSDALDHFGVRDRALRAAIRPIYPEAVVFGRAVPVQSLEVCRPGGR
jgi:hypothetical protein